MSHTSSILLARGHRRARRRAQNGLWQLASVVVSSVLVAPAFADQRVDCSGLDRFRVVVAQLQSGEEPAKPQWDALFETPGYAVLERQGQRPMYERVFSLAFLPANAEKREEALRNSPEAPLIRHAMRFIDEAEALASYEKHVRELPLDPLFRRSARLLPEGLVDQATPPTVAALIFQLDAYGTSVIAVDLFAAKEMGIEGLIAHEAHHYYTEKVSRLNTPPAKHDAYDLIHSIDQLRLEGIADLIDKPELFEADRRQTLGPLMHGYVQRYLPLMQQANENLARIDSLLQEAARDESQWKKCGAAMWASLPFGAHPQGFAMAKLIVSVLGEEALIPAVQNPLEFLRLYQIAALQRQDSDPTPARFSEPSMAFLDELERRFLTRTPSWSPEDD